jgi:diguanylate cyclase (GGDEF)-like protein
MPDHYLSDDYERWRSVAFTQIMLLVLAIQVVLLCVFEFDNVIPFAPEGTRMARLIIAVIISSQAVAMAAFHFARSRQLAVQIANLGIYAAIVGSSFNLGGPTSPNLPVLVLIPLFAGLFSGARWSVVWMLVCTATAVGLRIVSESGLEFPNIMDPANVPRADSIVLCVIYLATGAVVLTYEGLNRRLRTSLVSERSELAFLANHDPLTGLNNRRSYEFELDRAFKRATRVKQGFALIAVDLDDFKPVNDELGHAVGDALLRDVGERIRECLRLTDTVARVGGDEFAVLVEHVDSDADIAVILRKIENQMEIPFEIEGHRVGIRASLGSARYPDDGTTPDEVWRAADDAMYVAKRQRKGLG